MLFCDFYCFLDRSAGGPAGRGQGVAERGHGLAKGRPRIAKRGPRIAKWGSRTAKRGPRFTKRGHAIIKGCPGITMRGPRFAEWVPRFTTRGAMGSRSVAKGSPVRGAGRDRHPVPSRPIGSRPARRPPPPHSYHLQVGYFIYIGTFGDFRQFSWDSSLYNRTL